MVLGSPLGMSAQSPLPATGVSRCQLEGAHNRTRGKPLTSVCPLLPPLPPFATASRRVVPLGCLPLRPQRAGEAAGHVGPLVHHHLLPHKVGGDGRAQRSGDALLEPLTGLTTSAHGLPVSSATDRWGSLSATSGVRGSQTSERVSRQEGMSATAGRTGGGGRDVAAAGPLAETGCWA